MGSFGGTDVSAKSFADGSTATLAKACRKYLCNEAKDVDLRKWAAEGLAYLTLDADVKEDLIEDTKALNSLVDLAKTGQHVVQYPISSILVNLTNSYDQQEVLPELVELAKFAKQHVPERHVKDSDDFVKKRIYALSKCGVVNALVAMSNTKSESTREQIARVYLALATYEDLRGLLVQQGGAKALVPLALDNIDAGKVVAAQALAKIGVTMQPDMAFPGQRMLEVIRPLLQLLDIDKRAIENFEALMALTNLSSYGESARKRIVKEKGVPKIEHYMYEEHEELKRAACECMCNLVQNETVAKMFCGDNDRVKLWVLYCAEAGDEEENLELTRACAGGLAILSKEPKICHKITTVNNWNETLIRLISHQRPDIQHRGCYIVANMMEEKDIASTVVGWGNQLFEVLMAVSALDDKERQASKDLANQALEKAAEHGLIKHNN